MITVYSLAEAREQIGQSWCHDIIARKWSEDGHGYVVAITRQFNIDAQISPWELREPFAGEVFDQWMREECIECDDDGQWPDPTDVEEMRVN
jgi:hypothetical protein